MQLKRHLLPSLALAAASCLGLASAVQAADKPNILVIWGDDVGVHSLSLYNHGIQGFRTPNIDSIGQQGALFTDAYGEQSCTAGRSAFILGQHPFRTGLLTIGMPGSDHGIPDWAPTVAGVLKDEGYTTGQFGKNHLGDQDKHLPTAHGFDEFFGNLYHLNAEEEPETYYYPKDPEFRKKFGPRGVIHSFADGKIEDTGPLTRKPSTRKPWHTPRTSSSGLSKPTSRSLSGSTPPACTSGPVCPRKPKARPARVFMPTAWPSMTPWSVNCWPNSMS